MQTPGAPVTDFIAPEAYADAYRQVVTAMQDTYGIPVVIRDLPEPFTGDLDGATVLVDPILNHEDALFLVVHLFGHTVQWNIDATARALGQLEVKNPDETLLNDLAEYEHTAARYSLQLLHNCGLHAFDQWLADYAACDTSYLMHFYRTGEKRQFRSFWRSPAPLLQPLVIPAFKAQAFASRGGVVI